MYKDFTWEPSLDQPWTTDQIPWQSFPPPHPHDARTVKPVWQDTSMDWNVSAFLLKPLPSGSVRFEVV